MRTLSNTFAMTLAGAAALLAAACSSSKGTTPGTGSGGNDGGGGVSGCPLTPTATGFVDDSACSGVIGAWYAYGDSVGSAASTTSTDFADSDCGKAGYTTAQCSQITTPTPGQPFAPDPTTGAMCTSGIAAQVLPAGNPDYTDFFGAGIGLDFNNPGGDAGVKMPKDLSKYQGVQFDFSGTMIPAGNKIRVNFPFMGEHGNDSPYFAANKTDDHSTLSTTSTNKVLWGSVLGPAYLAGQTPPVTPPAFDPTQVLSIQFQVFTNASTSTPYAFCVNNLALIE
jgi:hypothetical protein